MILTVGNTKCGVGKTTLAVNPAVARALAGRDLLLVDGDEQGPALTFTELRADRLGQAGYPAVALTGPPLLRKVPKPPATYEDIYITLAGRPPSPLPTHPTAVATCM